MSASAPVLQVKHGLAEGFPIVRGQCPACGCRALFLGPGGYVACSIVGCPNPGAAADVLLRGSEAAQ